MNNDKDRATSNETIERNHRREALKKLGKYTAYVAPFTVLALSKKASAATSHGPVATNPSYRRGGGK